MFGTVNVIQEGDNVRNTYIEHDMELMLKDDKGYHASTLDIRNRDGEKLGKRQVDVYNRSDFKFQVYTISDFLANHVLGFVDEKEMVWIQTDDMIFCFSNMEYGHNYHLEFSKLKRAILHKATKL